MEILKFIESIIVVIVFGFIQHFNIIKITDYRIRIVVALIVFWQFDLFRCSLLYMCGYDYAMFALFQYNTKGIGLNIFYPEIYKPDRGIIYLYNRLLKNKTVTFTSLFDLYIFSSIFIFIHLIYLLIKCL